MTTAEDNADRMLTKAVALSLRTARRCCVFGVVLSVGLAACSYRAPDKSALHAKAVAVDPVEMDEVSTQAIVEEKAAPNPEVSTYPLVEIPPVGAVDAHVPGKRTVKTTVASIDRVVGDASVTLSMVEVPVAADEIEPVVTATPHPIAEPAGESPAPARPWNWLLAAMAVMMAAGAGLILRRRRTDTHAVAHDETLPLLSDAAAPAEAASVALEDTSDPAPMVFSSLEWSYRAPDYERQEHWDAMPALLIERESGLPAVMRASSEPLSGTTLEAWEKLLRQAIPGAESLTLPWLLVAVLLLRAESANPRDAEVLYAEAEQWIELSMAADVARGATWQARRIDVDLCRVRRQKGAARLLSLRGMPSRHAQALARGEPPVLFAWVDVLAFWAECQFGDAALARYAEAEAICVRLCELPSSADAAQLRRAEILRQRATIEQGGARLKSLDTAQALLDLLYERVPSADNALAVAVAALARGNVLPPEQAKEAYSHALMHAFTAEAEPRLRAESLQCRLAVQWAYESLPGMPVQSDVAISLSNRLEALRVQHPETVQRMARIHLRSADFARAAELCENAWRNGQATHALLATWRDICRQWASASNSPDQLVARQLAMRQLSIASAMR